MHAPFSPPNRRSGQLSAGAGRGELPLWAVLVVATGVLALGLRGSTAAVPTEPVEPPVNGSVASVVASTLQQALDELGDDFKIVVTMFYFEELSYKQIAEELAIPIGTVMSRLCRARRALRELLEPVAWEAPETRLRSVK